METLEGFDFQAIAFDKDGHAQSGVEELSRFVKDQSVTDVIFICHGFRNDENDARGLYGRFLKSFAQNRTNPSLAAQMAGRKFAVGGVLWPSMIFPEVDDSQGSAQSVGNQAQDRQRLESLKSTVAPEDKAKIDDMINLLPTAHNDPNAQLKLAAHLLSLASKQPVTDSNEFKAALSTATPDSLRNALLAGNTQAVTPVGGGAGGAGGIPGIVLQPVLGSAQSFLGNIAGFVPKFLNLTTFLLMFYRCGTVGETGISQAVRRVKDLSPNVRVHLVGHSLGGRAVTACAKGLLANLREHVDSMMLLQAAYSHFGLSKGGTLGTVNHPRGFFRDVIEQKIVKGPILATHSTHDSVVGFAYTSMAAVSLNNAKAIGDESSPFGGIGRNGVLHTTEAVSLQLNLPGAAYTFAKYRIHNLDGSRNEQGKPLIGSHGDVTNPAITWAFASLVATT